MSGRSVVMVGLAVVAAGLAVFLVLSGQSSPMELVWVLLRLAGLSRWVG